MGTFHYNFQSQYEPVAARQARQIRALTNMISQLNAGDDTLSEQEIEANLVLVGLRRKPDVGIPTPSHLGQFQTFEPDRPGFFARLWKTQTIEEKRVRQPAPSYVDLCRSLPPFVCRTMRPGCMQKRGSPKNHSTLEQAEEIKAQREFDDCPS